MTVHQTFESTQTIRKRGFKNHIQNPENEESVTHLKKLSVSPTSTINFTSSTVSLSTSSSFSDLDTETTVEISTTTKITDDEGNESFTQSFKYFKERQRPSYTMTYVSIDEVDKVYRSKYIKHSYRFSSSFYHTFLSVFELHNETMNIWSHLLGFVFILYVTYNLYYIFYPFEETVRYLPLKSPKAPYSIKELIYGIPEDVLQSRISTYNEAIANGKDYIEEFPWLEYFTFNLYMFCAASCLILSAIYHWFNSISVTIHNCLLKVDLSGVAILVAGSFVPSVYYSFYCNPALQQIYLIFSAFILALGLIAPWIEFEIKGHPIKPFLFASLAVAGLIPAYHWYQITPDYVLDELKFGHYYLFFWYGLGFFIYKFHFPQVFFRSKLFDNLIPSHALWHICVVCAIYAWFVYLVRYHQLLPVYGCRDY